MNNIEKKKPHRTSLSTAMSDHSSKQDFLKLLKRFGDYFSLKMSNLFPFSLLNLNSRSVGAVAGLAIAIIFTWKLLKSPSGSPRRRLNRQPPGTSGSDVNNLSDSSLASLEDLKTQNAKDELLQFVKLTLAQVVRQKLNDGRKVSCSLLGVILEETSAEELQKQATVRSSVLEVLLEIAKHTDIYFMEKVLDDESEKRILLALEDAGLFASGIIFKEKILFCSTENGRASFVRQLEPDWHIDTSPDIVFQLARFIRHELHISPAKSERTAPNVFSSPSLEQFFGSI